MVMGGWFITDVLNGKLTTHCNAMFKHSIRHYLHYITTTQFEFIGYFVFVIVIHRRSLYGGTLGRAN